MNARRLLRWFIGVTVAWAAVVRITGGGSVALAGVRLASREPIRPLVAAGIAVLVHLLIDRFGSGPDTLRQACAEIGDWPLWRWIAHQLRPSFVATALAAVVFVAGMKFGSRTAGGSDSFGYISQADLWLHGTLVTPMPGAANVPWPDAIRTFAPLGYRPSQDGRGIVPTYAPGLPLLMAGAKLVGGWRGIFWIVPLSGGLLVLATFGIGRRLGSATAGLVAAWLIATSPAFLYSLMQPMSDVPAAACWANATFLVLGTSMGAAGLAGAAAGLALLVRPNLILLAGAFALWICWQDWRVGRGVMRLRRVAAFGICVAVSAAVVARVNLTLFGSATSSGYGDLSVLFALFWVPANIRLYGAWVIESQTPLVLVGVAMALLPVRRVWKTAPAQRGASLLGLLVVTVLSSYFVYQPFDAWWYLRYLLPAWPAVFLGVGILVARAMETRRLVPAALALLAVGWLSTQGVMYAERHDAFTMRDNEIRYQAVAALVHANTDPSSIILSMQHSGSVRYYAGRNTLRYDLLDPAWLDPAVEWLRAHGAHPYLLVDDWECQRFRDRFSPANRLGSLTLTPTLVYEAATTSALYDLDAASGVAPTPRVVSHLSLPPGGAPPLPPPVLKFAR